METLQHYINNIWDNSILPTLADYIRIPNKSPAYDAEWQKNGYMEQAINLIKDWCLKNAASHMKLDIVRLEGRTPLLYLEIPGSSEDTILLYGHIDKQPEMTGWHAGLGPWQPVFQDGKLYGRGGADDGYAIFASLTAINALRAQNIPHARCVIIIEACEESGSYDLPFYIDALKEKIGTPSLIICLDSGCGNYEQLWATTSLRGLVNGVLTIDILKEGVHSGQGSGIAPSCFRVFRQLLSRIESEETGEIILDKLHVNIPPHRLAQATITANILKNDIAKAIPFLPNVQPVTDNATELLLNKTWRPALSITGLQGIPALHQGGNVTLPSLAAKLSIRLAPTCDAESASRLLKETLETNPPYGAKVKFNIEDTGSGWDAPAEEPWLTNAMHKASIEYFNKDVGYIGEGGSIPFMGMLGKKFPQAQFLITGVLGPASNAHGPNEFLHIAMGKNLTACVARIIADHFQR